MKATAVEFKLGIEWTLVFSVRTSVPQPVTSLGGGTQAREAAQTTEEKSSPRPGEEEPSCPCLSFSQLTHTEAGQYPGGLTPKGSFQHREECILIDFL